MFTTSSNTLSQREKKLIVALQQAKVRRAEGLFVAEGPKLIGETSTITAPSLLLDNVQDPGNIGSILRTADWFGYRTVFTTEGTADPFSPKVVQATMGALARVKVTPVADIHSLLGQAHKDGVAILGTFLEGEDILAHHSTPLFSSPYLLIMGNEGQGISPSVAQYVTQRLTIPPSSPDGKQVESLNVAAATAIVLACLHRH